MDDAAIPNGLVADNLADCRQDELDEAVVRQILKIGLDGRDQVDKFIESDDLEVRTFCRRIKMERRLRQSGTNSETNSDQPTALEIQIKTSTSKIKELLEDSLRSIINVRVAALRSEDARQERDKRRREEIDTLISEEAASAADKFEEIDMKWAVVNRKKDPLDIHEETEKQRDDCVALLEQKDALIDNLKCRLKQADKDFYAELSKQNDYMNILSDRINEHINLMSDCYRMELQNLQVRKKAFDETESVIGAEKDKVLNARVNQWKEMSEMKEALEVQNIAVRYNFIQQYEKQLDSVLIEQHELMRFQKIKMESRLNKLIFEESRFRSAALINSELVHYNVQILQRREEEHRALKGHQKRLVNKWQESVRNLRQQKNDEIGCLLAEKTRAMEELEKVTNEVRGTKERLRILDAFSHQRYVQLWEFNLANGEELMNKLMQEDQYFHKELLYVPWRPPYNELSKQRKFSAFCTKALTKGEKGKATKLRLLGKSIKGGQVPKLSHLVVSSLLNDVDFLVSDEVKRLVEPVDEQGAALICLHHIFEALGLTTKEDVDLLLTAFQPLIRCRDCQEAQHEKSLKEQKMDRIDEVSRRLGSQVKMLSRLKEEGFPEDELRRKSIGVVFEFDEESKETVKSGDSVSSVCTAQGHRLSVNFIDVAKVLREFAADINEHKRVNTVGDEDLSDTPLYTELSMQKVQDFWSELPAVFDAKKRMMWKSLLSNIKDYYKTQLRRSVLTQRLSRLESQNMELRRLLVRYIPRAPAKECYTSSNIPVFGEVKQCEQGPASSIETPQT